eukprot:CAMPEP_0113944542 /NCGR_PEP_ID=MMETSP1339-20121228/34488_1 /TAXON_ID=94617 /ORGANISM="Fibrocapsa japonica" /LENGTH=464 /DNA_ID=CAMNT_0000949777 /DNA_START=255 /DNA_END=1646 /DNA_ORIENTATION=+ /assembly_acc=CAM_ASM_000762
MTCTFSYDSASFLALHFSQFALQEHDIVKVCDDSESCFPMDHMFKSRAHGVFWGPSIVGDTIKLVSKLQNPNSHWSISQISHGYPSLDLRPARRVAENDARRDLRVGSRAHSTLFTPETVCTDDDRREAICYASENPTIYERAQAVARLIIQGAWVCTGWLTGTDGHLMTNEHCIGSADDALNTDVYFDAEDPSCDNPSPSNVPGVDFAGGTVLMKLDADKDYALVYIEPYNGKFPAYMPDMLTKRPSLEPDPTVIMSNDDAFAAATLNRQIYIPQHPGGRDKQIAWTDSYHSSGNCTVTAMGSPYCTASNPSMYKELSYACDTEGGSSGSPVLAADTNKVVGLHHCGGGCAGNVAVALNTIYKDICSDLATCQVWGCCAFCDVDTDGDGSYDCEDECPLNPDVQVAGKCGCDEADVDADGDGILDCLGGAPSCAGYCGGSGSDGACWCDSTCISFGDCCADAC